MTEVVVLGEVMVELHEAGGVTHRGMGGDTFNTAVYLARTGAARVRYATALGADHLSDEIVAAAEAEGVDTSLVARLADRLPGLYLVQVDAAGERRFLYWRHDSAARRMLDGDVSGLGAALVAADWVVYSGITLAILTPDRRDALHALVAEARAAGTRVLFDPNHRAGLWESPVSARANTWTAVRSADVVIASDEDGAALFGARSAEDSARCLATACSEVVVTAGVRSTVLAVEDGLHLVVPPTVEVLDTTAAGDAFDAAYLGARLGGASPLAAIARGHALAARVVGHRGALRPRS